MVWRNAIALYSVKDTDILCGQNAEFSMLYYVEGFKYLSTSIGLSTLSRTASCEEFIKAR
jgi:hypothetical protein